MPCKCRFFFIKGSSPSYSMLTFSELVLIPQSVSEKFHDVFLVWRIREELKIKFCGFGLSLTNERDYFHILGAGRCQGGKW